VNVLTDKFYLDAGNQDDDEDGVGFDGDDCENDSQKKDAETGLINVIMFLGGCLIVSECIFLLYNIYDWLGYIVNALYGN